MSVDNICGRFRGEMYLWNMWCRNIAQKKKRDIAPAINLIPTVIKGNYYFIATKRDVNVTRDPSRIAISATKSNGDFVMQANKVAPANFSKTLQEEEPTGSI